MWLILFLKICNSSGIISRLILIIERVIQCHARYRLTLQVLNYLNYDHTDL